VKNRGLISKSFPKKWFNSWSEFLSKGMLSDEVSSAWSVILVCSKLRVVKIGQVAFEIQQNQLNVDFKLGGSDPWKSVSGEKDQSEMHHPACLHEA